MLQKKSYRAFETLVARSCAPPPFRKRERANEMNSLRQIDERINADWLKPLRRLNRLIGQLFVLPGGGMNNNMCKNYGCVIREYGYSCRARCGDCGKIITNTSHLRASTLLPERPKGFDLV